MLKPPRLLSLLVLITGIVLVITGDAAGQTQCGIIASTGTCVSLNTVITGVNAGTAAVCETDAVYGETGGPVGPVLGFMFIIAYNSVACPVGSSAITTFQKAVTLQASNTALEAERLSLADSDITRVLLQDSSQEDCATGFTQGPTVLDPLVCGGPILDFGGDPATCLGSSDLSSQFTNPDGTAPAPLCSPIILDLSGDGFVLTSAAEGVRFDISGTGHKVQIAWTAPGSQNAFLVLPGPSGVVDNGKQLFGNFTPQPLSPHPNGFLALAVYDQPANGGNGDGIIDGQDKIFSSLRLWIDANHDGICQPEELHSLPEMGVSSISLNYHLSPKQDRYGNQFRYRAKVNPVDPRDESEVGKTTYDVFLITVN